MKKEDKELLRLTGAKSIKREIDKKSGYTIIKLIFPLFKEKNENEMLRIYKS